MRHYPASNLIPGHPNSLQNVRPKGAADWTSLINDELCYCRDGGVMRVYQFQAASTDIENIPEVVIPTGNGTGVGRWHQIQFFTSGGGSSLIDFIENDSVGGSLYTFRKYEDPFSMVQGNGTLTGIPSLPTWEGDVWKGQEISSDNGIGYGAVLYLKSDGTWEGARANGINMGQLYGLSLNPPALTGATDQEILIKGVMKHDYLSTFLGGTVGGPLYLSTTSQGRLTGVKPTEDWLQILGVMLGARHLWFDPDKTVLELTPSGGGG